MQNHITKWFITPKCTIYCPLFVQPVFHTYVGLMMLWPNDFTTMKNTHYASGWSFGVKIVLPQCSSCSKSLLKGVLVKHSGSKAEFNNTLIFFSDRSQPFQTFMLVVDIANTRLNRPSEV